MNYNKSSLSMTRSNGGLRMELDPARATIARGGLVVRCFAGRVCKRYLSLGRPQSTSCRAHLIVLLADAQLKSEYLDGFRVRVSNTGHSQRIGDVDSDEERRVSTHSHVPMAMILKWHLSRSGLRSLPAYSVRLHHHEVCSICQ